MGNAMSLAITDAWPASTEKRVKKWLDNATEASVLDSLTSHFYPTGPGYGLPAARDAVPYIKETFNAYGSIDLVDKNRYWHEHDLELSLSVHFGGSELNASIPVLWRCFHFNAYFPFPRKPDRLDYSAFQRAIGLLAAEGKMKLGDNAEGITMDLERYPDADARASKQLWILFKSLSARPPYMGELSSRKPSEKDLSTTEDDLMDVLALTQPAHPCMMPAPIEELRPYARRILSPSTPHDFFSIPSEDLLSLLKLLLSIHVKKPEGHALFHTARLSPRDTKDPADGIADALMRRFAPNGEDGISWHDFSNAVDLYLPNIPVRFQLLFTTFLSPPIHLSHSFDTSLSMSMVPGTYAPCLSLFLHSPVAGPNNRHEQFGRLGATFENIQPFYSASPAAFSATELAAALLPIETATLLLISGDAIKDDPTSDVHPDYRPIRATFGACIPTPWDLPHQRRYKANPAPNCTPDHILFQLEPRIEILLPDAEAWITDLISITPSAPETGKTGALRFGTEDGSGLSVDFTTGIATIRSFLRAQQNNDTNDTKNLDQQNHQNTQGFGYTDISALEESLEKPAEEWVTRMRMQKFEIYNLGGSVALPFDENAAATVSRNPRLRPQPVEQHPNKRFEGLVMTPSEPEVGRDELRRRIEGFGSGT